MPHKEWSVVVYDDTGAIIHSHKGLNMFEAIPLQTEYVSKGYTRVACSNTDLTAKGNINPKETYESDR